MNSTQQPETSYAEVFTSGETDNELRQALLENVMDETIDAEAVRS